MTTTSEIEMTAPSTKSRAWAFAEFALVAFWFCADIFRWGHHIVILSKTIDLFLLGWVSLWLRGIGWRGVGLRRPLGWRKALLLGVGAGLAMEALELFITQPLLERIFHKPPDLSSIMELFGNWKMLLLALALTWTLAAFGEEMVYRGYLMNRVTDLVGKSRAGWATALLLVSVVFGLAHYYQGITGITENFIDGLLLGLIYFAAGRNLWAPIVAHGITDSLDSVLIFSGHYPGMHIGLH
jgi:uncharacterized protein